MYSMDPPGKAADSEKTMVGSERPIWSFEYSSGTVSREREREDSE